MSFTVTSNSERFSGVIRRKPLRIASFRRLWQYWAVTLLWTRINSGENLQNVNLFRAFLICFRSLLPGYSLTTAVFNPQSERHVAGVDGEKRFFVAYGPQVNVPIALTLSEQASLSE